MRDAFLEFKSNPSSDALIALLRAHQERIYRLCYQVLHNAADAEDAAQGALLKIADGARRFDDPEPFQRWLYRVSLNAALEAARKAARRRDHEARSAMQKPPPTPPDPDARLALFEAMAGLDDTSRAFLLRHHLEGEELQSIAERAGYSVSGVSRRMERAREKLRRRLGGAAFAGFEWLSAPTPVPPDLVSGPVLAKVAAVTGGALMFTKSVLVVAVVVAAVLALTAGAGIVAVTTSRADSVVTHPHPAPTSEAVAASPSISTPVESKREETVSPSSLQGRLNRFRTWAAEWHADRKRFMEEHVLDQKAQFAYVQEKQKELMLELGDINVLILKDPDTFFRFLKDPENEFCASDLTAYGFGFFKWNNGSPYGMKLEYTSFPQDLIDGFYELLRTGSPVLKMAALGFFGQVSGLPPEFTTHWTALINDADQKVVHRSLQLISQGHSVPKETLEAIFKVGRASPDVEVRREAASAMSWVQDPSAGAFLLERMETVTEAYEVTSAVAAMYSKFYAAQRGGSKVDEARFLRAVSGIMNRELDSGTLKILVGAALNVPPSKSRPVVERALAVAPDLECRDAIGRVLQKIDAGETDQKKLNELLWASP